MIPSEGCPDVEQGVLTRHSLLFLYPLAVSLASGGWGRSPQASKLDERVASRARNTPHSESGGLPPAFFSHGPRSGSTCQDAP